MQKNDLMTHIKSIEKLKKKNRGIMPILRIPRFDLQMHGERIKKKGKCD